MNLKRVLFLKLLFFSLSSLIFIQANKVFGAACCSGSNALPAFITTDDKWLLGVGSSYSKIIGDAPENGTPVFRRKTEEQTNLTHRIETSYLLKEGLQAGVVFPVQQREQRDASYKNKIGDIRTSAFYEFLPEYTYSKWKPRGFTYFVVTFPTGKSIYETDQSTGLNSFGRGFYSFSVGNFWLKKWNAWDVNFFYQVGYSLPRTFQDIDGLQLKVFPGFNATASLGSGYNFSDYRIGLRVQPNFFQKKKIQNNAAETWTASEMYWDTSIDFGYLPVDFLSIVLSYTDQTFLGPAHNTTLSRSAGLSAQYRLGI